MSEWWTPVTGMARERTQRRVATDQSYKLNKKYRTSCYLSTALSLQTENIVLQQILSWFILFSLPPCLNSKHHSQ